MKACRFEYRFRFLLHGLIFTLGLWAPWNRWLHLDPVGANAHVWGLLAENLVQLGVKISAAFDAVLVAAIVCATAGAWLRTWGSAYLGAAVVESSGMHTGGERGILRDGPFRFVRNPLYLGTFLHTLAVSVLMQRSGAFFAIALIGVFQVRLILAEESFLEMKLGERYAAYCGLVPRLLPRLRAAVAGESVRPRWGQAVLSEVYFWGVAGSFAALGWRYNETLLIQCVVVSAGVSLIMRALAQRVVGEGQ